MCIPHTARMQGAYTAAGGVLIRIPPRHNAFAVHRLIVAGLIVADRRPGPDRPKARKDLARAAVLICVPAGDHPDELREACGNALSRGPKWRDHIGARAPGA